MADQLLHSRRSFHNYPLAKEVPPPSPSEQPLSKATNPVLRGLPLTIAATITSAFDFIASYLYRNAGFPKIHQVQDLNTYLPCYNPAVVPIMNDGMTPKRSAASVLSPVPRVNVAYSARDYHELYRSQKLTPTAVVAVLLPLICKSGKTPGGHSVAFLQVREDIVTSAAEASTQRYRKGKPLSMLDGVPIAVKDEFDLEGYAKSLGSSIDFTPVVNKTSWCIAKLEEVGAIVIGKCSMHELGLDTTNLNPITGTPLNPHNPRYYTGGSSGGSAYAVASGLVPIALGADGGGSIRIPSSFCGIYGLKPSHDRISQAPGSSSASTTCVVGPMAASLDDLILAYRIMATPDPQHPVSCMFPDPLDELLSRVWTHSSDTSTAARHPRYIGVDADWLSRSEPSIRAIFSRLMTYYSSMSTTPYTIVPISLPNLQSGQLAHALTILCEIRSMLSPAQLSLLTAPNKILMSVAGQVPTGDFLAAQRLRALLMAHLAHVWQQYPGMIIASPTTPLPGWEVEQPDVDLKTGVSDGDKSTHNMTYVWLANFAGTPAITWPVGESVGSSVPVGLMGMGEWGNEEGLFEWARHGEGFWDANESGGTEGVGLTEESGVTRLRSPGEKEHGNWVDVIQAVTPYIGHASDPYGTF